MPERSAGPDTSTWVDGHPIGLLSLADRAQLRKYPNPEPSDGLPSAQSHERFQTSAAGFLPMLQEEAERRSKQEGRDGFGSSSIDVGGADDKSAEVDLSAVSVLVSTTTATAPLDSKSVSPTRTTSSLTVSQILQIQSTTRVARIIDTYNETPPPTLSSDGSASQQESKRRRRVGKAGFKSEQTWLTEASMQKVDDVPMDCLEITECYERPDGFFLCRLCSKRADGFFSRTPEFEERVDGSCQYEFCFESCESRCIACARTRSVWFYVSL